MATTSKHYKMFCKMCFDSGKTEEEYTNHWVKDSKGGKVVCPTLLAHECGYCHELGHTPKFCPRLASRNERQKKHMERKQKNKNACRHLGAFTVKIAEQIQKKEEKHLQQKRVRACCNDNQYAVLMGVKERDAKRKRGHEKTEAVPLWSGPKVTPPPTPQGAWGKAAKAMAVVQDMTSTEVDQLKILLKQMGIIDKPSTTPNKEEQAWLEQQMMKQTDEETAEGEAFFDNDLDVEEAVMSIENENCDNHEKCNGIALPDECNLDKDFGSNTGNDGWGETEFAPNNCFDTFA